MAGSRRAPGARRMISCPPWLSSRAGVAIRVRRRVAIIALPPRVPCPSSSSPPDIRPVSWCSQAATAAAEVSTPAKTAACDVGAFAGPAGTFRQRTEITKPQAAILKALDISAPPRIYQLNRRGGIAPTAPPPDTRRLTDAKARHLIGCTCVRLSGMAVLLLVRGYGMMTSLRAAVPVL